jgi:hypothetical protein
MAALFDSLASVQSSAIANQQRPLGELEARFYHRRDLAPRL